MKSYPNANYKGVIMANLAIDNIILARIEFKISHDLF